MPIRIQQCTIHVKRNENGYTRDVINETEKWKLSYCTVDDILFITCLRWGNKVWQFYAPRDPIAGWQTAHVALTLFSCYVAED
jgi:hypothetical protein